MTFWVPAARLAELTEAVEKLNRRAKKLGVSPVQVVPTGGYESRRINVAYGEWEKPVWVERSFVEIKVVGGEAPRLPGGWEFAAVLEPLGESCIVNFTPILERDEDWRAAQAVAGRERFSEKGMYCDHCKAFRRRKEIFLLVNEEGETVWVGRQCLRDFLGHTSPENLVARFQWFRQLQDYLGGGYPRPVPMYPTRGVLECTVCAIAIDGWRSRGKARDEGGAATADNVQFAFVGDSKEAREYRATLHDYYAENESHIQARVEKALTWIREMDQDEANKSDYISNLKTACCAEEIKLKHFGLVCSLLVAYDKHIETEADRQRREREREDRAKATADSQHLGEKGERLELEAEVVMMRDVDSFYGPSVLFKFVADGNVLTWFCSGRTPDVEVGDKVQVRGTVKKHDEYKGTKNTQLTRCTVKGSNNDSK
jgi:hypothetical protein